MITITVGDYAHQYYERYMKNEGKENMFLRCPFENEMVPTWISRGESKKVSFTDISPISSHDLVSNWASGMYGDRASEEVVIVLDDVRKVVERMDFLYHLNLILPLSGDMKYIRYDMKYEICEIWLVIVENGRW